MNILHAAETITGGVASVMRLLLAHQIANPAYHVIALVPENQRGELVGIPDSHVDGFGSRRRSVGGMLAFTLAFTGVVWRTRPDIVHLHSTFAGVFGRLALLALWPWRRPKVVYCPHAFAFLMATSSTQKRIYGLVEWLLTPLTHAFVCVSAYERDKARHAGLSARKLHLIYNGVPPVSNSTATRPSKGVIQAVFVGRFDRQKGFDVLHKAMQQLQGIVHLTAIGAPVHGAAMPVAADNITYTGWLKPHEVRTHLQTADVLVLPSRWEGFAMVPLEAMANGLAVLASDACSLPEAVLDGKTGHVFPTDDWEVLAKILKRTSRAQWHKLGAAGHAHFIKNFTAAAMLAATDKLYAKVLP